MAEAAIDRSQAVVRTWSAQRRAIVLAFGTGVLVLTLGCDRGAAPPVERAGGGASPMHTQGEEDSGDQAEPVVIDDAAQKLDSGLHAADRALKAGQYAECRREVAAYLQRAGSSARTAQAEFMIGLSYHRPRIFGEARPHFARAIELEPGFFATYYFYGYCLFNLGRLEEADAALATYLRWRPDEPDAIFGQGLVAIEADRVDDAERLILRAIELTEAKRRQGDTSAGLKKDAARYQSRLADVYLRRDDLVQAKKSLERAIELWPEFFESWNKLHKVQTRLGDTAAAEKALAKYQELFERRTKGTGGNR